MALGCAAALCLGALAAVPARATYAGTDGAIAYIAGDTGSYEVHAIRPDGSGAANVSRMCAFSGSIGREPDWSPDGSMIAYNYNLLLYVQRTDGGRPSRLVNSGLNIEDGAAWSPDGGRIAFDGAANGSNGVRDIYAVNRDGTGLTNLTNTPDLSESNPSWSPDGTTLVFTQESVPSIAVPTSSFLFTMPAGGGERTQLTSARVDGPLVQDDGADWSPDGSSIVFRRDSDNVWAIYVVSAYGGEPTALTQPGLRVDSPSWSPSGKRIAFSGTVGEIGNAVWVVNADGSGTHLLVGPGLADATPDWGTAQSYVGGRCGQQPDNFGEDPGTGPPKLFGKPRAVRGGVAWRLGCIARAPRRCNTTLKLTGATSGDTRGRAAALLGKTSKSIRPGQTRLVVAKLNRPGRRALQTKGRLSVRATAVISYRQAGTTKRHTRRRTLQLRR